MQLISMKQKGSPSSPLSDVLYVVDSNNDDYNNGDDNNNDYDNNYNSN